MEYKDSPLLAEIKDKKRYGVFLDMGVGKTALLLSLLDYKLFEGVKKVLIIAPKQVSLATWQDEMRKWQKFRYMENIVSLISGTTKQREAILKDTKEFQIHIISSSLVDWLYTGSSAAMNKTHFFVNKIRPKYDLIIVDECSEFKTPSSRRFRALRYIVEKDDPELYLLSGTPFPNIREDNYSMKNGDELYYVFYLLGLFKGGITKFREKFCFQKPWDRYSYYIAPIKYELMMDDLAQVSIRERLELDIEVESEIVYCLSDVERMKTLKNDYYIETNELEAITTMNRNLMINKALQLANGFAYDDEKNVKRFNTYKYEKMLELLEKIEGNVLINYLFVEDKDYILKHLKGAVLLDNDASYKAWNEGKIKYGIFSPYSSKFGLNLQKGGNTIIWFGLTWSAENVIQTNARLIRKGQEKDVKIYYLMARDSFDKYAYDVVFNKVDLIKAFLNYVRDEN